jgi:DNA-binding NarL/FixJ family response regulator
LGTKRIKADFPRVKVVILTTFQDDEYILEAIRHGAAGYILKNQPSDSILESLRAVEKGISVFGQEVTRTLSGFLKDSLLKIPPQIELTSRELDVIQLIGEGLSNKEIAERLYLSEGTTRNYVTSLLEKLNLRDRTQLAIYYLKHY